MIAKIKKMIADGWMLEGSFYVFDEGAGKHYYEMRLSRNGEKAVVASDMHYPHSFDADGNMISEKACSKKRC